MVKFMQDITVFTEKEAAGLVTLVRITDDSVAFSTKRFNPDTGHELAEEVVGGSIKEYKDEVVKLQARISELNSFITKAEALVPQNK
jgi:hypothetical protein